MTSKERLDFDSVLHRWGYNVFLQRRKNAYTAETAVYRDSLEKHTVRSTYGRKNALAQNVGEEQEGIVYDFDLVFYFRYDAAPKRGDRIYESTIEGIDNCAIYIVDLALPMRGHAGEIVYWTVGATEEVVL